LVGLLFAGLLAGATLAEAAAPKTNKTKVEPFATQISELHAVKVLLQKADHDYKGHRAAAVKHVTAAIHDLRVHKATKTSGGKVQGGGESQEVSDAQLREAIKGLQVVQKQLAGSNVDRAAKAAVAVGKAIKELEVALEIR
jgi:hypothetical protein